MPRAHRGALRLVLAILLLVAGALLATRLGTGSRSVVQEDVSATLFAPAQLRVSYGRNRLEVVATTVSADHEAALLSLVADQFDNAHVHTEFHTGFLLRPEWQNISTRALYLVATTTSATATVDEQIASIHGVTDDMRNYSSRLQFLRAALGDGGQVTSAVIAVDTAAGAEDLCTQNFAAITDPATVALAIVFGESSAELSHAAVPLLDRLAEFAYDCRDRKILILGYTDASGPAAWNRQLSAARAQAVATQLVRRGVSADRLLVEGRGAESPLADNDTAQGRAQNRRIEFELR
jgi:outer membrane protein OmpA-like peptidoglycan-associated protein